MGASFSRQLALTLSMIKFSHSVFALPFALASALFARGGMPEGRDIALLVVCMVAARNVAMTFNRIADRNIDALNPRTKDRPLAAGTLTLRFSLGFCLINAVLFVAAAAPFNRLALILSPLALAVICFYSLAKRFTHYTQIFLGISLGIAPIAAWIALTGAVTAFPLLLGAGVAFWVAGFDLIYSCLDHDFDVRHGVKNLTAKLGSGRALILSRVLHVLSVISFLAAGRVLNLGAWYHLGLFAVAVCLAYEQSLVSSRDLTRVNAAFFTVNGCVALLFLGFSAMEIFTPLPTMR